LLLLSGSVTAKRIEDRWQASNGSGPALRDLLTAGSYLDWFSAVLPRWTAPCNWFESGVAAGLAWRVHAPGEATAEAAVDAELLDEVGQVDARPSEEELRVLEGRVTWRYSFSAATKEPAKTSVSALRRRALEDRDDEAVIWQPPGGSGGTTGIDVGIAHHLLLETVSMAEAVDVAALRVEARRLVSSGLISPAQHEALDLEAVAEFWRSPVGERIRGQKPAAVHRELPFTARFTLKDLKELNLVQGENGGDLGEAEWVSVQGVVDLAVIRDDEIWVLDFKTDRVLDLSGKVEGYKPQLRLYALALERIYGRPVTQVWLHFFALRETVSLARSWA
jgi:ATP-dependent helicase/nuclease subunit A